MQDYLTQKRARTQADIQTWLRDRPWDTYPVTAAQAAEQYLAASVALMALIWVTSLAIFLATSLAAEAPEAVPVTMDHCVEQTSRPAFV